MKYTIIRENGRVTIDGVIEVHSFDESECIIECEGALLKFTMLDLNVDDINYDIGKVVLSGILRSVSETSHYNEKRMF